MHLVRMLCELMPDNTDVQGLYALLLVTDARRGIRVDAGDRLVRLKDQCVDLNPSVLRRWRRRLGNCGG
jgi:predicted RNA polymerase sigma factor